MSLESPPESSSPDEETEDQNELTQPELSLQLIKDFDLDGGNSTDFQHWELTGFQPEASLSNEDLLQQFNDPFEGTVDPFTNLDDAYLWDFDLG